MADVFIAYADANQPAARFIRDGLEVSGLSVRMGSPDSPQAGIVREALSQSRSVVVLLSKRAAGDGWVLKAADYGRKKNVLVLALIESANLPKRFAGIKPVDLRIWSNNNDEDPAFKELVTEVKKVLAGAQLQPIRRRKAFICYRRDDTQDAAAHLYERLLSVYGRERVIWDIDSIPLAVNFKTHIEKELQRSAAVLVMIGRNWSSIADEQGNRRLDNPNDHVRMEIATALRLGVPIVPLLVQNAQMPQPKDLPSNIRDLHLQNGMPLPRAFWTEAVEKLVKRLEPLMGKVKGGR